MLAHYLNLVATNIHPGGLPQGPSDGTAIVTVLHIVLNIIGAMALLMIAVSGLRYVLSAGEPDKASKAKNTLAYSLVGLLIAIAAQAVVSFVVTRL